MRHIQTPITINYVSDGNSIGETLHELIDATGRVVCNDEPYYPQKVKPEHIEDIALTVNTHDELVEALEAIAQVDGACSVQDGIVCFEDGELIDLKALITKAKGGQP